MGSASQEEATPIVNATAVQDYGGADSIAIHNNDQEDDVIVPLVNVVVDGPISDPDAVAAPVWRDVPFAVLFWIHLAVMVWLGLSTSSKGFDLIDVNVNVRDIEDAMRKSDDITEDDIHHFEDFMENAAAYLEVYPTRIVTLLILPCCLSAFLFGLIGMNHIIKPCPKTIVYSCLIASIAGITLTLLASAIASGEVFLYITSGLSLIAVGYFVKMVWKMVPFAAFNMKFSLEGISQNWGIFIVAFLFAEVGFLWVVYWFYIVIGTSLYENQKCQDAHPEANFDMSSDDYSDVCDPPVPVFLFFIFSLYWTSAIIMNSMQVCVAGVMATFCLDKSDADRCCSPAICGSLYRSMTFSFGSICLGSLLQAIVAVLRYLIDSARARRERNEDAGACGSLLLCIADCLAEIMEELLRAFNQWAYIFVGLYGFGYVESGKRVMELFQAKGFTAIITDNLVGYVLGFVSFAIALVTAFAAWLIEISFSKGKGHDPTQNLDEGDYSYIFGPLPDSGGLAALVGFVVGLWVGTVMMNVIRGAVNTLIVCWADSPGAMITQHPVLTQELSDTYNQVFDLPQTTQPTVTTSSTNPSSIVV